ncbi:uncharacterized protein LOC112085449 [Eutrema salsugineum]|uniref:uncharacterized protein LOC112085449 n=1 Tax=Eutrema salsugineum TaxID=72664 RepID=UPI000CED77DE|nr:uncharacterized protein LOC112085449 [Eutrema salsugineum]
MASSSNNPHYNPYDGGNDGLYNPYDGVNDGLDESFDEMFDDMFDQKFDSAFNALLERQAGSKPKKKKRQRREAVGRLSLSGLQKCTAAIRILAYGSVADAVDEYLRLRESTAIKCLEKFTEGIISLFGDEYLRRPTPEDLKKLLDVGEDRGFPGIVGSIDCMH